MSRNPISNAYKVHTKSFAALHVASSEASDSGRDAHMLRPYPRAIRCIDLDSVHIVTKCNGVLILYSR